MLLIKNDFMLSASFMYIMSSPSVKPIQMDKLPLPVVISFIRSKVREGETIRIGNKIFPKVICGGNVVSCRPVRTLSSTEYVVADPSEDASAFKEISVLYREEPSSSLKSEQFLPGTLVFIYGKLTRFKGAVAIQAITIRQLIHPDEYECLKMEAFLALQYHTKNPSGQTPIRCAQGSPLPLPLLTSPSSVVGKRPSSTTSSFTPTPKRPSISRIPSASSYILRANTDRQPVQKSRTGIEQNEISAMKEAGSQDSFEDAVFLEN